MVSDLESVAKIDFLIRDQYFMNVIRMGGSLLHRITDHLENVLQTIRIVNINVSDPIGSIGKE